MKNKDFDNIDKLAQDAFKDFEVEFNPMDWMDMQSKLNAESMIDKTAREALSDFEVPFDEKVWQVFEKQLDKKRHLYPAIWWMKGAEAGIMALLVFTIFNLTSTKNNYSLSNQNYDSTTTLTPSSTTDLNQNNAAEQHDDTYHINGKEEQSNEDAADINATTVEENGAQAMNAASINQSNGNFENSTANLNKANVANKYLASNEVSSSLTDKNASNRSYNNNTSTVFGNGKQDDEVPNQNLIGLTGKDGTVNLSNTETTEINTTNSDLKETLVSGPIHENSANTKNAETLFTKYATLEIPTLNAKAGIKHTDPVFELKKLKLELPYHCKTYIGGVVVVGANFASSLGGTSIGYGAGLTIDSELSRLVALKSGMVLSYKKFDINETSVLDKTAVDGNIYEVDMTKTTNLVVIEIPLDVQFTFLKNEKWRIFATAGIAANLIGSRTYNGSQKTSYNGLSIRTDINSNDYERGLFEGGQFTNNAFLSLGASLGLERQLGDKISLYIMPSYKHAITPIGGDFMSSFGVNIGVKTSL